MAKAESLQFKELLDAQKRLAAKGDARAAEQVKKLTAMAKELGEQGDTLKKQSASLNNIEKNQNLDKAIQILQTKQQSDIVEDSDKSLIDEDKLVKQSEALNKTIKKGMLDKTGDGLNSNVIRLFGEIKKISKLTPEQAKEVLSKTREKREFKTIGSRIESLKEGTKDFFTARGFLDKTGIVSRGSGGIFSEYLDAKEARQQQAKARIASGERARDPETGKILDVKGSQKQFEKQAKEEQQLRREQGKLERKIEKEYSPYLSEEKIAQTPEAKRLKEIAERSVQLNPSLAPEGYNPQEPSKKAATKVTEKDMVPFVVPNQEAVATGTTSEEAASENARVQQKQLEILEKIEENTRKDQSRKPEVKKEEENKSIFGNLFDGLKNVFSGLKNGIMRVIGAIGPTLMRAIGPLLGVMGQVAVVGAAVYGASKVIDKGYEAVTGKSSDFYNKSYDPKTTPKEMQEKIKAEKLAGTFDETSGMGKAKARTMEDYEKQLKETGKVKNALGQDITEKATKELSDYKQLKQFKETDPYQQYKREVEAKDFKGAERPTFEQWQAKKSSAEAITPSPMTAAPQAAETIYNKSAEVSPSAAKLATENKTLVNAPTTINKSTQTNYTKLPVRNNDPAYMDYIRKRFSI